jgi:hypothetical protein
MKNDIWSKNVGTIAIAFGLIALAIYMVMINITLAHIESITGLAPFDMRPTGYGTVDAVALLDALGKDGRDYYVTHQIPLDMIYPAMLAISLASAMFWFGQAAPHSYFVRAGIVISIGAALCDYCENLGIISMIWMWPTLPEFLVYAASIATIAKSVLTTLAVFFLLLVAFRWGRIRRPLKRFV